MKFARLGAAPLPAIIFLISACSDPPSPPAQAAVTLSIAPASGKTCNHTQPQLALPSKSTASVEAELACDLAAGCKPDDYIVVNQDRGTTVACTVSPAGGNFNVQLSVIVDGSATNELSMQFGLNGTLTPMGGMASINSSSSISRSNGIDPSCNVSIANPYSTLTNVVGAPKQGVVSKGKIWGAFECNAFRNPTDIGDTGCLAQGVFLFENCDS